MKRFILFIAAITLSLLFVCTFGAQGAQAAIENNCANGVGNVSGGCSGTGAPPSSGTSTSTTIGGQGTYSGTCSQLQGVMSAGGFVQKFLCTSDNGTAVEVIIQNLANYILSLATFVFLVMLGLGFVQIMAGGGSPEAIKAGKRRITLAVSSIALFIVGRLVLDLLGITGGKFLGVEVATGFDAGKINEIIAAVWNYILYAGGFFAVFMIMYGGFTMLTSAGNPQRIQTSRRIIMYAIIGLVGLVGAGLIYSIVASALGAK